jgi:hypothetical protein
MTDMSLTSFEGSLAAGSHTQQLHDLGQQSAGFPITESAGLTTPSQALGGPPHRIHLAAMDLPRRPEPTLDLSRLNDAMTIDDPASSRQGDGRGSLSLMLIGRYDALADEIDIWGLLDSERLTWS